MSSGHGVPKPNMADHPNRQVGLERFGRAASYRNGYRDNDPNHNSQLSALHMALNDPAGR